MPRGQEYRIPLSELLWAADRHRQDGWSLRFIAGSRWRQWGYASPGSALEALRHALRTIDQPVRDCIEATRLASLMHGDSTRAARQPGHPDHERYLEHRRRTRRPRSRPAMDQS